MCSKEVLANQKSHQPGHQAATVILSSLMGTGWEDTCPKLHNSTDLGEVYTEFLERLVFSTRR